MNGNVVQSTLRQLQAKGRSRSLWSTFVAIAVLFIVTGPYGTGQKMAFWPRAAYWTLLLGSGWIITTGFSAFANAALVRTLTSPLARMMAGAIAAALPIGATITLANHAFFAQPVDIASIGEDAQAALPLCLIFCFLGYLTAGPANTTDPTEETGAETTPPPSVKERPAILDRLEPERRGPLLRLSVQDHYTEVVTTRGCQLVLLRFADAMKEIGDTKGLQVHRSHWIADADVVSLRKQAGRLHLMTRDGTEIPVSRSHNAAVQARFAAHALAG
ncbi:MULTISPECIES: LytTR family DNA-binding domain-containing protein [Rhizobium/Agrobacterium group]|uniref:LytTR family DNA-binding domain-containing protein n=1 Tax=Rhizobium/Agrobacterium group TaxID=227290 RepID=UPI0022C16BAA|nr:MULTISPECIES: LytTR family transcriptional regulator DNA-binding domain-containing protein [Rhizobium/Agrobacterium group]MCZ7453084.1 LytTR family transcriptional regulator DNA-binding domain-containing protein [Rhizobium rhizogenes]